LVSNSQPVGHSRLLVRRGCSELLARPKKRCRGLLQATARVQQLSGEWGWRVMMRRVVLSLFVEGERASPAWAGGGGAWCVGSRPL